MSLFKKIKTLIGNEQTVTATVATDIPTVFSPETLDSPPYTFVDAMRAARQGDGQKIQNYLNFNKFYARCKNWDDCTLLHEAARFSRPDIVKLLLSQQADANALYKDQAPIHFVIEGDAREIVNKTPEQQLDYRKRRKETVNALIEQGANLNSTNAVGETPLHLSARLGYSELVELLLNHDSKAVDKRIESNNSNATNVGRTPLLLAVRYNKDRKTIKTLLEHGANPNLIDCDPGYNALHYIASHHSVNQVIKESDLKELTLLLIKGGVNVNAETGDNTYQTALHLAIHYHHTGVIDALLEHGANVSAKDKKGMMPMSIAARNGDAEMVDCLLKHGTDIYESRALFHAASCRRSDAALKLLLDRGVDINMPDSNGYTPIFNAISAHSVTNVKLLLEKGVDIKLHSPNGLTVLEHAFACWGEVECLSDDEISEERQSAADNSRDIIQLLGGFDRPEKKLFF